jgi:hypothetical protein
VTLGVLLTLLSGCLSKLEDAVEKTNLTTKELELLQSKYGALTLMSHPEYSPHARYLGARKCFLDTEDKEVYMYLGAIKKLIEPTVAEYGGIPNVTIVADKPVPEITELLPFPPVNMDTYQIMELTVMTLLNRYAGALAQPLSGKDYDEIADNVERMLVHVAPTVLGALKVEFVRTPAGVEKLEFHPVRGNRRFNRNHAIELMHSIVAAFTATQGRPLRAGLVEDMERNITGKIVSSFR